MTVIEQISVLGVGLGITLLFTYSSLFQELGYWKIVTSMRSLCVYILTFGLPLAIIRFVSRNLKNNTKDINEKILILVILVSLGILFLLLNTVGFYLSAFFERDNLTAYQTTTISVFLSIYTINELIGRSFINGYQARWIIANITISRSVIVIIYLCSCYLFYNISAVHLVSLLTLLYFFEFLFFLFWHVKIAQIGLPKRAAENKGTGLYAFYQFAAWQFITKVLLASRDVASNNLIIAFFLSPLDVAIYSLSLLIPSVIRAFSPAKLFANIFIPRLTIVGKNPKDSELNELRYVFVNLNKVNIIFFGCLLFLIGRHIDYILMILNLDPSASNRLIFQLSLLVCIIGIITDSYYIILTALGRSKQLFYLSAIGAVGFLVSLFLVPVYGAIGAILSSLITTIFVLIFCETLNKITKLHFKIIDVTTINFLVFLLIELSLLNLIENYTMHIVSTVLEIMIIMLFIIINLINDRELRLFIWGFFRR